MRRGENMGPVNGQLVMTGKKSKKKRIFSDMIGIPFSSSHPSLRRKKMRRLAGGEGD